MKTQATQTNDMLRIGVIHQGRIVEDHLFKTKARVTAGRSPRNGLSLPAARMPNHVKLVETRRGQQHLCFEKGMRGKIFTGSEVLDLRTAARRLALRKGDRFFLPLDRDVRASIRLGDATFLLQRVHAPVRTHRLALPREARGSWWRNMDKSFLSVLALSLFAQGGFEAVQELYWRDTGQFLVKERTGAPKLLQALVINDMRTLDEDPVIAEITPTDAPSEAPVEPEEPTLPNLAIVAVDEPRDPISEAGDPALVLDVPAGPLGDRAMGTTRLVDARDANIDFSHVNPMVPGARPSRAPRLANSTAAPATGNVGAVRVLKSMYGDLRSPGVGVARHDDPWGGEGNTITSYAAAGDPNGIWDSDPGLIPATALIGEQPGAAALVNALINETAPRAPMPVISAPRAPLVVAEAETPTARKIVVRGGKPSRVVGRGRLDAAAIHAEVRKRTPGLQRLFLDAVRKNPALHGRIEVRITVGISGRAKVVVTSDRIGDDAFAQALTRRIASWRFPKPKGGEVSFKVPFTFRAI